MKKSSTDTFDDFDPAVISREFSLGVILEGMPVEEILGDAVDDDRYTDEDPDINVELEVYTAAPNNELDRMKELIGPEVTDKNRLWAESAMHIAASRNSIECGRFLIAFNPDVLEALNGQRLSPIDIARRNGNIDFINMCWQERMKLLNDRAVIEK